MIKWNISDLCLNKDVPDKTFFFVSACSNWVLLGAERCFSMPNQRQEVPSNKSEVNENQNHGNRNLNEKLSIDFKQIIFNHQIYFFKFSEV